MVATYHPPTKFNFKRKDLIMKKYLVEITEKITYKVEFSADSQEYAERRVREMYDSGALVGIGELESVSFDVVEDKEGV
jgi:hypothetical protein